MTALVKYKRVAQRLREQFGEKEFALQYIEDAIFIECGTDPRTIKNALETMKRLKLIESVQTQIKEFGVLPERKYKLAAYKDEMF